MRTLLFIEHFLKKNGIETPGKVADGLSHDLRFPAFTPIVDASDFCKYRRP